MISPDWIEIRKDFPVLDQKMNGKRLYYLDNAASSQMPLPAIERISNYLKYEHSNIHRGVHALSQAATNSFEATRELVKTHINALSTSECIFTRGATESINLVAHGYGDKFIKEDDVIVVSQMEHHSNIVPWQMLCKRRGAILKVIPMLDNGTLDFDAYLELLTPKVKIVALIHVSNALGTINPIKKFISEAHQVNALTVIDGCQAMAHMSVDVQDLDADFYAFSAHKTYGPTGLGVLFGKAELLNKMDPFLGGGDMIKSVTFEETLIADIPHKFEAGTPPILNVIGFGESLRYIRKIGIKNIAEREDELLEYATQGVLEIDGIKIIGPDLHEKTAILSMTFDTVHPHDIGTILDSEGVAIRAGHHCAQPVMKRLGIAATARASFAFYNNKEDADALVHALKQVKEIFG